MTSSFFFSNPSSPGRRLEFVVAVVLLLCDLWRGADHQDTALQRSRASAGGQGLRGQREGDPGLPRWPLSQWVKPTWTQRQHLHHSCSSVTGIQASPSLADSPRQHFLCFGLTSCCFVRKCQLKSTQYVSSRTINVPDSLSAFGIFWPEGVHMLQKQLTNVPGIRKLNVKLCALTVDGGWGPWSPWATCSVTCGGGVKNRMRECNSPEPQHGGRKCIGKAGDSDSCNKKVCPIGEYKSLFSVF